MKEEVQLLRSLIDEERWVECALYGEYIGEQALEAGDIDKTGEAFFACGYGRGKLDDVEGSIKAYERARLAGFKGSGALFNLANAYRVKGESLKALEVYEELLEVDPSHGGAICNLAFTWEDIGNLERAEYYFKEGAIKNTKDKEALQNYAYTLLRQGELKEGWKIYEQREGKDKLLLIDDNYTTQTSVRDKNVLIGVEQGYGDVIMFAGLINEILEEARSITLVCDKRLSPILSRSLPGVNVLEAIERVNLSRFDVRMGIASLGHCCRNVSQHQFKSIRPYLVPSPKAAKRIRDKLRQTKERETLIGIAWRGGGDERNKKRRSIELTEMLRVANIEGVRWINMQYGNVGEEIEEARKELGIVVEDLFDATRDFDSLVAALYEVDAVLTVQQSLVHFAGACGIVTNALIPAIPEWRYGTTSTKMLWWENVHLIRQDKYGSWKEALLKAKQNLQEGIRKK